MSKMHPSTLEEQRPDTQDHEMWKAFWTKQGQIWRKEPEIIATAVGAIIGFTFEGIFIAMLTQRFFGI
jgi:hypothetical protein